MVVQLWHPNLYPQHKEWECYNPAYLKDRWKPLDFMKPFLVNFPSDKYNDSWDICQNSFSSSKANGCAKTKLPQKFAMKCSDSHEVKQCASLWAIRRDLYICRGFKYMLIIMYMKILLQATKIGCPLFRSSMQTGWRRPMKIRRTILRSVMIGSRCYWFHWVSRAIARVGVRQVSLFRPTRPRWSFQLGYTRMVLFLASTSKHKASDIHVLWIHTRKQNII